ncbi:hypothetical protein IV203_001385 [Nitzschia inconspicua]|uniref:Uncharacterized protein n=1 Tax=Nitzschia inconspicua TaxID=303405 RepID=A0A9K3PTI6_9STRA|nr:hypothetical protein IV203_001385 [Nitzschia inconspicua]
MTANQRVWGAIGAVIITGTVFKVTYFRYCREMMIQQADKSHLTATEHYREAKEFAKWSAQDRAEKRAELPPLTPEQRDQMRAYLRLMQEYHAFNPDSDVDPETGKPR